MGILDDLLFGPSSRTADKNRGATKITKKDIKRESFWTGPAFKKDATVLERVYRKRAEEGNLRAQKIVAHIDAIKLYEQYKDRMKTEGRVKEIKSFKSWKHRK